MRRFAPQIVGLGCALTLLVVCFYSVLFRGHQFAYRDSGHFYYPLYRVVQQEWEAGRWPLWNPWQNGGTPLLGMPMAAVLYPGKLIYAVLPYPQAARWYVLAHTIIALLGMRALGRALGLSGTGALLAAMSYAFSTPVLSQYSNVIFLVGAAWLPWGFRAIHRMVALGTSWGILELSVVLAMQVLGGDPEAAYLTVASGVLYVGILALDRDHSVSEMAARRRTVGMRSLIVLFAWFALVLGAAYGVPRAWAATWVSRGRILGPVIGLGMAIVIFRRLRRRGVRTGLRTMLGRLATAGLLALALSAVQIGPTWELACRSTRMTGHSGSSVYDFSVEPYRLLEAIWPHVFGLEVPEHRSWIQAVPPVGERMLWSPSLYAGAMVVVLALGAAGLRGGPPWRSWLTILAMVSLMGAMGKFAGPLWWARWIPGVADLVGAHDPRGGIDRPDVFLSDGAGSVYGVLSTLLPGFSLFRYPSKLIVFTVLAMSALAGLGWDRLSRAESPPASTRRWCLTGFVASVGLVLLIVVGRMGIERWLSQHVPPSSLFGPVDAAGAVNETLRALVQGGVVCASAAVLATWASRRPAATGVGALLILTADLAMAGSRIVWTVPQADFDTTPHLVRLIDQAEQSDPSQGPFRIHRVEQWHPHEFLERRSPNRLSELIAWEHVTLDRLHAEPFSMAYTVIRGVLDVEEYLDFFEAQVAWGRDEHGTGRPIYSFPRGGYDLWNARYFLMPVGLNGWMGPERGFTRIAPTDAIVRDPDRAQQWIDRQGWQLLRNRQVLPRCWVVESALTIPPTATGSPERAELVRTLVNSTVGSAIVRRQGTVDLQRMAFIETDDAAPLAALRTQPSPGPTGSVAITKADPQRVELRATLREPGLVILADLFYPGWNLTIDGIAAPIWRTNRMMRGALVPAGAHTLIYFYRSEAIRLGAFVSIGGLIVLGGLMIWAGRKHRFVAGTTSLSTTVR